MSKAESVEEKGDKKRIEVRQAKIGSCDVFVCPEVRFW